MQSKTFINTKFIRTIILCVATLIAVSSSAQEKSNSTAIPGSGRVQIGFSFSPDICYRTLQNNDGSASSNSVVNQRNKDERVKLGFTTGLNVCFKLNANMGLETGLLYSNKGYQTKMKDVVFMQPDPTIPTKARFLYNYYYVDIPLKVNFMIGRGKVRFITSAGITTNFFIDETVTSELVYTNRTETKTEPSTFNYNKINISPMISAGIDYKINSKMNLRIEPTIRYGLLKIIDTPVTGYLYNCGLNIGYYLNL